MGGMMLEAIREMLGRLGTEGDVGQIGNEDSLLENGVLDSAAMVELIEQLAAEMRELSERGESQLSQINQLEADSAALSMANRLKTNERARWEILTSTLEKDPAKALELAKAHPDINARPKMHYGTNDQGVDPMLALPVLNALQTSPRDGGLKP